MHSHMSGVRCHVLCVRCHVSQQVTTLKNFNYVLEMKNNHVFHNKMEKKNHAKRGYTESLKIIENQEKQEKLRKSKKNQEKPRK